jgi:CRP-like cAMP-binding protein
VVQNLINHIRKFCPIEQEKIGAIGQFVEAKTFGKKQLLLGEGQRCYHKFFIVKGCVQICYLRQNGTEQTIDFAMENWWTTDVMAFQQGTIAQFSIRAIETTEVLSISADRQRTLLTQIPELQEYFHLVYQKAYAASQMRIKMLYELSKEELYRDFNEKYPAFVQRVPQYLLASFLGFTPEYLSEIRRKFVS